MFSGPGGFRSISNRPNLNVSNVDLPNVAIPIVDLPKFNLANLNLPKLNHPNVDLPNLDLKLLAGYPDKSVSGTTLHKNHFDHNHLNRDGLSMNEC